MSEQEQDSQDSQDSPSADDLIIENNADTGISLLSPDANEDDFFTIRPAEHNVEILNLSATGVITFHSDSDSDGFSIEQDGRLELSGENKETNPVKVLDRMIEAFSKPAAGYNPLSQWVGLLRYIREAEKLKHEVTNGMMAKITAAKSGSTEPASRRPRRHVIVIGPRLAGKTQDG